MADQSPGDQVKITAVERAHPAIRTLARACIALARWQREHQAAASLEESNEASPWTGTTPAGEAADA